MRSQLTDVDDGDGIDVSDYFADAFADIQRKPAPQNRVRGPYDSAGHYLRTQLRMLAADFWQPLIRSLRTMRVSHTSLADSHENDDDDFGSVADDVPSNGEFWAYNDKRIVWQTLHESSGTGGFVVHLRKSEMSALQRQHDKCTSRADDISASNAPFKNGSLLVFASGVRMRRLLLATVVEPNWKRSWVGNVECVGGI